MESSTEWWKEKALGPNRDQAKLFFKDQVRGEPVGQLRPNSSRRFVRYLQQKGTYRTPCPHHKALTTKREKY